jgi:hypothetical protein
MGLLTDLWYLHREAILRIAGACMLIAAAAVVIATARGAVGGYEVGATAGLVLRTIAVPVVGVGVVGYLVRRWYWYEDEASWRELTPESIAVAGSISLALALFGGWGAAQADDSDLIESAITRTFMESDPALCDEVYTQALIDQMHIGTGVVAQADCREDEAEPNPPGTDPDSVSISGLAIQGGEATATVAVLGGALDQARFRLQLVNDEGNWKLDRLLHVDLDRAAFDRGLADRMRAEGLNAEEVSCAVRQYHEETTLGELEKAVVTGVPTSDPDWDVSCFTVDTLKTKLIEGSREAVRERGFPDDATRCLMDELRGLSARRLRFIYKDPHGDAVQAMIRQLMERCLAAAEASSPA